jgi:hypothetical protein
MHGRSLPLLVAVTLLLFLSVGPVKAQVTGSAANQSVSIPNVIRYSGQSRLERLEKLLEEKAK